MKIYNDYDMADYLNSEITDDYDATELKWLKLFDVIKGLSKHKLAVTVNNKTHEFKIQTRKEMFDDIKCQNQILN